MSDKYILDKEYWLKGWQLQQDIDIISNLLCSEEYNEAMYLLGHFCGQLQDFIGGFEPDMGDDCYGE